MCTWFNMYRMYMNQNFGKVKIWVLRAPINSKSANMYQDLWWVKEELYCILHSGKNEKRKYGQLQTRPKIAGHQNLIVNVMGFSNFATLINTLKGLCNVCIQILIIYCHTITSTSLHTQKWQRLDASMTIVITLK